MSPDREVERKEGPTVQPLGELTTISRTPPTTVQRICAAATAELQGILSALEGIEDKAVDAYRHLVWTTDRVWRLEHAAAVFKKMAGAQLFLTGLGPETVDTTTFSLDECARRCGELRESISTDSKDAVITKAILDFEALVQGFEKEGGERYLTVECLRTHGAEIVAGVAKVLEARGQIPLPSFDVARLKSALAPENLGKVVDVYPTIADELSDLSSESCSPKIIDFYRSNRDPNVATLMAVASFVRCQLHLHHLITFPSFKVPDGVVDDICRRVKGCRNGIGFLIDALADSFERRWLTRSWEDLCEQVGALLIAGTEDRKRAARSELLASNLLTRDEVYKLSWAKGAPVDDKTFFLFERRRKVATASIKRHFATTEGATEFASRIEILRSALSAGTDDFKPGQSHLDFARAQIPYQKQLLEDLLRPFSVSAPRGTNGHYFVQLVGLRTDPSAVLGVSVEDAPVVVSASYPRTVAADAPK